MDEIKVKFDLNLILWEPNRMAAQRLPSAPHSYK